MTTTVYGTATKVGEIAVEQNMIDDVVGAHSFKSLSLELPPGGVAIDCDHDHKPVGRLIYAELGADEALRCVAVLDNDQLATIDRPVYFSPELEMRGDVDRSFYVAREAALLGLSLTFETKTLAAQPIKWRAGDLRSSVDRYRWPVSWQHTDPLLSRALDQLGTGHGVEHRAATCIADRRRRALPTLEPVSSGPAGAIEYRSVGGHVNVANGRTLELLAAPYRVPATVVVRGRQVEEEFTNAAFLGRQPDKIKSFRDHDITKPIGLVTNLDALDPQGLRASIRVSRCRDGNDVLALAEDGLVDPSIAFSIEPGGERWQGHRRVVTRATVHEISLVGIGAYAPAARVLDVRDRELAGAR